jgi:lipopolysaccharide biosynthesis glycosyltransferase
MKSPKNMKVIQIEITNTCGNRCANCTRFCGHQKTPFFMDFETFKKAVDSMKGFTGVVGIMGGEPTLHPEFERFVTYFKENFGRNDTSRVFKGPDKDFLGYICNHVFNIIRNNQRGLWSSMGLQYYRHFELIQDTFGYQVLNDHSHPSAHETLMVTRKELGIPDEKWYKMRDNCWVQNYWSASITPKGAFFCEVAAALDMLLDGPGGWDIEPGWWKRRPDEFGDQLHWCELCSAPLAMPRRNANKEIDDASPRWYSILSEIQSPKFLKGKVQEFDVTTYNEKRYSVIDEATPYLEDQTKRFVRRTGKLEPHTIDIWIDLRNVESDEGIQVLAKNQLVTQINGIIVTDDSQYHDYLPYGIPIVRVSGNDSAGKIFQISEECKSKDFVILFKNYIFKGNPREVISQFVYNPGMLYYYQDKIGEFSLFSLRASSLKSNPLLDTIRKVYPPYKQVRLETIPDSSVAVYQVSSKPSSFIDNDVFHPILAGKAGLNESSPIPGDDTGDTISDKHETYSYLTALYWIWKNDTSHTYLGLCHDDNVLIFSGKKISKWDTVSIHRLFYADMELFGWDPGSVIEFVRDTDIVVGRCRHVPPGESERSYFIKKYGNGLYQKIIEGVRQYAPEYDPYVRKYFEGKTLRPRHLFVMRRDLLHLYCEWLFSLLEKIFPPEDFCNTRADAVYEPVVVAERLFHIYLEKLTKDHPELTYKEIPSVFIEDTSPVVSSLAQLSANKPPVPIITTLDTNNSAVFSVFLESLKTVSSPSFCYDIIVLSDRVTDYTKKQLYKQAESDENISLRFFEMNSYPLKECLNEYDHYSRSILFRLKIPSILPGYSKIIYLDPDVIFLKDPAILFSENISDVYAGVVKCLYTLQVRLSGLRLPKPYNRYNLQEYFEKELCLSETGIENYFNTGVMVLNLEKIRHDGIEEQWLSLFYSKEYYRAEQDIMNMSFDGHVKILPQGWNFSNLSPQEPFDGISCSFSKRTEKGTEHPSIIRYTLRDKESQESEPGLFSDVFWMHARKSPFYEILLKQFISENPESGKNSERKSRYKNPTALINKRKSILNNQLIPYLRLIRERSHRLYYYIADQIVRN